MSVGLLVGGAFLGLAGGRLMRNMVFSSEDETKSPDTMGMRKNGLLDRLQANPILMAQYNEKYVQKKLSSCSGVMDNANKLTIGRTKSLKKVSGSEAERTKQGNLLNSISAAPALA